MVGVIWELEFAGFCLCGGFCAFTGKSWCFLSFWSVSGYFGGLLFILGFP